MNVIMVELIDNWNQLRAKLPLNFAKNMFH
jgi:hypothetical protein